MSAYSVTESDQFVLDVEECAVWILESNLEQSERFAQAKVDELGAELNALKSRLQHFPESGEADEILTGLRRFPIYEGRFSVKWVVNLADRTVILIALTDSRYPKLLREFHLDDEAAEE